MASLRCGNLRSFTQSKLSQVILARLATLASCFVLIAFYSLQKKRKKDEKIMIVTSENITSKHRSKLKSIAANLSPVTQNGKGGITDNLLKTLSDALDAHEIIKVNILETADEDPRNLAENVAELLEAVPVAVIGRKAISYRYSRRDKFAHLEF